MKSRKLPIILVAITILVLVIVQAVNAEQIESDGTVADSAPRASHRLIVELNSPALSQWAATEISASATSDLFVNGHLNVASTTAQAYIQQLQAEQGAFMAQMQRAVPSSRAATFMDEAGRVHNATYQIVMNAVAVDAGQDVDVKALAQEMSKLPGVKAVYRDYALEPQTYASLPLINVSAIWDSETVGGGENAGAGIKIASVDGGVHHDAPMFNGEGYEWPEDIPEPGLGDISNNNGKIIVSRAYFRTWDPPSEGDENVWPGTQGTSHGVHTASTAAGNSVKADYVGVENIDVSGVAPKAWIMSYRVFYASVSNNEQAYSIEIIAALEDMISDGADVVNNSWGDGPQSSGGEFDALDTALLNAWDAGVFVSMSAGNAGPGNGTTDHPSDYIIVAASTTDGTFATGRFNVTAPEPVPDELVDIAFATASFGAGLPLGTTVGPFSYVTAASVSSANFEGCNAWPEGTFSGKAAVISRGACEFGLKVFNAEQAGAEFVVIYNHANGGDSLVNMGGGAVGDQVTIPSIFVGHTDGLALVDWYETSGDSSEFVVDTLAFQVGSTPDQIARFSSRGPGVGNVLKPDIAAPGVNILAQGYTVGATGEDRHVGYGQVSGTSMASPHVAGSAALLKQIHPDWSNAAIKSALMSTSKYTEIYNFDGSPAQPLDMGAGRLDLTNAASPGVILDPPSLSFGSVVSGTVSSIDVTLTSVADHTETYTISTLYTGDGFDDMPAVPGLSVSPASVTLEPDESTIVAVQWDLPQSWVMATIRAMSSSPARITKRTCPRGCVWPMKMKVLMCLSLTMTLVIYSAMPTTRLYTQER